MLPRPSATGRSLTWKCHGRGPAGLSSLQGLAAASFGCVQDVHVHLLSIIWGGYIASKSGLLACRLPGNSLVAYDLSGNLHPNQSHIGRRAVARPGQQPDAPSSHRPAVRLDCLFMAEADQAEDSLYGNGAPSVASSCRDYADYEHGFPLGDVTGGVKGIREALVAHYESANWDAESALAGSENNSQPEHLQAEMPVDYPATQLAWDPVSSP